MFLGGEDLRYVVETAFNDQAASHSTGHLKRGRSVNMRVIPERARRMIFRDFDTDLIVAARLHPAQYVIRDSVRVHMQAMSMNVGCIEMVRLVVVLWHVIGVWRQHVADGHVQDIAWLQAQGRADEAAVVASMRDAAAGDLAGAVFDVQDNVQFATLGPNLQGALERPEAVRTDVYRSRSTGISHGIRFFGRRRKTKN